MKQECNGGDDIKCLTFWDANIGGAPGGTFATMFSILDGTARKAPKYRIDPYINLGNNEKSKFVCRSANPTLPERTSLPWLLRPGNNRSMNCWTIPFVMAGVNYEIVRWSYATRQQGNPTIVYKEAMLVPNFYTAFTAYGGLAMFGSMLFNPLTSYLLKKFVLPKSGEGPSMNKMENERKSSHHMPSSIAYHPYWRVAEPLFFFFLSFTDILFSDFLCVYGEGIGSNGTVVESIFYLPKDAGCLETSRMMIESGLCLALQEDQLPVKDGGFYSPSVALGNDVLLNRLTNTGTQFLIRVVPPNEIATPPTK
jgi:short subunit dehydrogenase-like uncharacterized protein